MTTTEWLLLGVVIDLAIFGLGYLLRVWFHRWDDAEVVLRNPGMLGGSTTLTGYSPRAVARIRVDLAAYEAAVGRGPQQ